ncbi:MAG: alpha/beta fold hydrolase [Alphaproteobacteria bacterium]|nr:alpha/beta fold hydrolase [Alphaproteobacteria bacterium]
MDKTPNIEERFQQPAHWHWRHFIHKNRTIRFGCCLPESGQPEAIIVCMPGLSEFGEKYFELARNLRDQNFAVWVIDWMGQGHSERYFKSNPHKRHSHGIENDVEDLHMLYTKHIEPNNVGTAPIIMLAHSMGGNIGLRYLAKHPKTFRAAFFSAPLLGLTVTKPLPRFIAQGFLSLMNILAGRSYAPGQTNWRENMRPSPGSDIFSSDPARGALQNYWCLFDTQLQNGGITWGWLYQIYKSCGILQKSETLQKIDIPCLFALAGRDELVDNDAARKIAVQLNQAKTIDFPEGLHELLMEKDEIRTPIIEAITKLVKSACADSHNP